jgi:hypothetical protein
MGQGYAHFTTCRCGGALRDRGSFRKPTSSGSTSGVPLGRATTAPNGYEAASCAAVSAPATIRDDAHSNGETVPIAHNSDYIEGLGAIGLAHQAAESDHIELVP